MTMKQKRNELPLDIKFIFIGMVVALIVLLASMFIGTAEANMYLNEEQEVCGYQSAGGFECSSQLNAYKNILGSNCEYNIDYAIENKKLCDKVKLEMVRDSEGHWIGYKKRTWTWDWILQDNSDAWTDGEKIYKKSK